MGDNGVIMPYNKHKGRQIVIPQRKENQFHFEYKIFNKTVWLMAYGLGRQFLGWWLKCPALQPNLNDTLLISDYDAINIFKANPMAQVIYSFVLAMILFYILLLLRNFYCYFFYPAWQMRPVSSKKRRSRSKSKLKSQIEHDVMTAVLQANHHEVKMNEPVPLVYKRRRSNNSGHKCKTGDLLTTKTARSPKSSSPKNSRSELSTMSSSTSNTSLPSLSTSFDTSSTFPSTSNHNSTSANSKLSSPGIKSDKNQ